MLVIRRKQSGSGNGEWTFDLRLAPAALLRLAAEAEKEDGEETEKHEQVRREQSAQCFVCLFRENTLAFFLVLARVLTVFRLSLGACHCATYGGC